MGVSFKIAKRLGNVGMDPMAQTSLNVMIRTAFARMVVAIARTRPANARTWTAVQALVPPGVQAAHLPSLTPPQATVRAQLVVLNRPPHPLVFKALHQAHQAIALLLVQLNP